MMILCPLISWGAVSGHGFHQNFKSLPDIQNKDPLPRILPGEGEILRFKVKVSSQAELKEYTTWEIRRGEQCAPMRTDGFVTWSPYPGEGFLILRVHAVKQTVSEDFEMETAHLLVQEDGARILPLRSSLMWNIIRVGPDSFMFVSEMMIQSTEAIQRTGEATHLTNWPEQRVAHLVGTWPPAAAFSPVLRNERVNTYEKRNIRGIETTCFEQFRPEDPDFRGIQCIGQEGISYFAEYRKEKLLFSAERIH